MIAERIKLPGFGLPVKYRPRESFPNAVEEWTPDGTSWNQSKLRLPSTNGKKFENLEQQPATLPDSVTFSPPSPTRLGQKPSLG